MKRPELAQASYASLLASARAFHELIFRTLTSSLIISILQYGAIRSRSPVLLFLLVLAYGAFAIYTLCFMRLVLFASFERAGGGGGIRSVALWTSAGLTTGFAIALPSVFTSVTGLLMRRAPLP